MRINPGMKNQTPPAKDARVEGVDYEAYMRDAPAVEGTAVHGSNTDFMHRLAKLAVSRPLRVGIDYRNGKLWYGFVAGGLCFLTSNHDKVMAANLPKELATKEVKTLELPISPQGAMRHLAGDKVDGAKLLAVLTAFFRTYVSFEHEFQAVALAHWTLATYLYMVFRIFPYVWLKSVMGGSGKTTVLEILSHLAFRGDGTTSVDATDAAIFRKVDQLGNVNIVDEFDKMKEDNRQALLSIFNQGFLHSGAVERCDKENPNIVKQFRAYSPKAFAGLEAVPETFASRCIKITMIRKSKAVALPPFSPHTDVMVQAAIQRFRDDMGLWALENARACAELALRAEELGIPDGNRAKDIMVPLFVVAKVAGTNAAPLVDLCRSLADERQEDGQEHVISKVLQVVLKAVDGEELKIYSGELVNRLAATGVHMSEENLGKLLSGIGLPTKQFRMGTDNKKGLSVAAKKVREVATSYGVE